MHLNPLRTAASGSFHAGPIDVKDHRTCGRHRGIFEHPDYEWSETEAQLSWHAAARKAGLGWFGACLGVSPSRVSMKPGHQHARRMNRTHLCFSYSSFVCVGWLRSWLCLAFAAVLPLQRAPLKLDPTRGVKPNQSHALQKVRDREGGATSRISNLGQPHLQ